MASPYTRLYTEDEEYAYDSGRMDMRAEVLQELRKLRKFYLSVDQYDQSLVVELIMGRIYSLCDLVEELESNA